MRDTNRWSGGARWGVLAAAVVLVALLVGALGGRGGVPGAGATAAGGVRGGSEATAVGDGRPGVAQADGLSEADADAAVAAAIRILRAGRHRDGDG
jgi:hypothetical protein